MFGKICLSGVCGEIQSYIIKHRWIIFYQRGGIVNIL